MNYGKGLMHEKLEEEFAAYVGTKYAVAVNTGGMALQMSLRALGVKPGDEVLHQVDTCMANPYAVMNAFATPILTDISGDTFMMDFNDAEKSISKNTKVIMPIHMWGNPCNMDSVAELAAKHKLYVIEDSCLSLGAVWKGKKTGSMGNVGVFSLGCIKPIQAGEGGMITTNDAALAKELRTLRSWGEMTAEYGVRDHKELAWNGRMSEIVAAVGLEQLRGYSSQLEKKMEALELFKSYITQREGIQIVDAGLNGVSSYSQVVLKLNSSALGLSKNELMHSMTENGIIHWHANFEPVNQLQFFTQGNWKKWITTGDLQKAENNFSRKFSNSERVYAEEGLGLNNSHFLSKKEVSALMLKMDKILKRK
jgi:perosamine synthetase